MLLNSNLRYKPNVFSKFLNEQILDLGKKTFRIPTRFLYRVVRITPAYIARPDKVSKDLYGSEMYGDLLCKVNGISNPFELNEDDILIVPSISDLDEFVLIQDFDDIEDERNDASRPKPKKKKDKRKASDSIIGDARFKIDNTRRVIIY